MVNQNNKKANLVDIAFFLLNFTFICSLNSLTAIFLGVAQIASPLILILCFFILYKGGISKKSFGNIEFILLYLFIFGYYCFGFITRFVLSDTITYKLALQPHMMNFITTIIVIFTYHQYFIQNLIINQKVRIVFLYNYIPLLLSSSVVIVQAFTGIYAFGAYAGDGSRAMGVFGNPNSAGLVANIAMAYNIYGIFKFKNGFLWRFALVPVLFYVAIATFSRSAIIISVAIIIFSIFFYSKVIYERNNYNKIKYSIFTIVPIIFALFAVTSFDSLLETYFDPGQAKKLNSIVKLLVDREVNSETTSERTQVFEYGVKRISDRPIFGNGIGYFGLFPDMLGYGAHNTFLLIWGDSGIFAFIPYIFFLIFISAKGMWYRNAEAILAFFLVLIFAMYNMGSHNGIDDKITNLICAFAAGYSVFASRKKLVEANKHL